MMGQNEATGCWCDDHSRPTCNGQCRMFAERERYQAALRQIAEGDFPMATVTEDMQRIAKKALGG